MGIRTNNTHNGDDAVFELRALIVSICFTVDQRAQLRQGESMQPMLPAVWEAGFDWATGKISAAGDHVDTESEDCLEIAKLDGTEASVDNSDDVRDGQGADQISTIIARDAARSRILPIVHVASTRPSPITPNTHTAPSIDEVASIGRPQTSAAMWAAFRRWKHLHDKMKGRNKDLNWFVSTAQVNR